MQQFARVLTHNGVVPVVLKGSEHLDLRPIVTDITAAAIADGALANVDIAGLSPISGEFTYLAPIEGIRQIAATGFNYKKHIEEFKMKPPAEPEVFLKAISSLAGPSDPISRGPNKNVKLDWETELAIVIGREAKDLGVAEAARHIFGYVCLNDVSDRTTQVDAEGQQHLVRAKSRPTYCPIGPYLTTGVDGMNLDVWTKLNGQYEQKATPATCCSASARWWPASPPTCCYCRETFWLRERRRVSASARTGIWQWATCSSAASPIWAFSAMRYECKCRSARFGASTQGVARLMVASSGAFNVKLCYCRSARKAVCRGRCRFFQSNERNERW